MTLAWQNEDWYPGRACPGPAPGPAASLYIIGHTTGPALHRQNVLPANDHEFGSIITCDPKAHIVTAVHFQESWHIQEPRWQLKTQAINSPHRP